MNVFCLWVHSTQYSVYFGLDTVALYLTVVCAEFPIIFPTISREEELNLAHHTSPTLLSGTLLRVAIPSFNGQEMGMKE